MNLRRYAPLVRVLGLAFAVACLSGCTLGYRHAAHSGTLTNSLGEAKVSGAGDEIDLAVTADFRYVRLMLPIEVSRHKLAFDAYDGGRDTGDLIRERRRYRLEVPFLSLYNFDTGGFGGYPGALRHRHTIDLWVGAETDMLRQIEWWVDLGASLYKHGGIGFSIFGGVGSMPVAAATPVAGSRFPTLWEGRTVSFSGGAAVTITSGEFALGALEYLLGMDKRHRDRVQRQNPGR